VTDDLIAVTASRILDVSGGSGNILCATNCATRVRLRFVSVPSGVRERFASIPGVAGVLVRGDEYQLVVGFEAALIAGCIRAAKKTE
jgi:phosphotransferase system IIB component